MSAPSVIQPSESTTTYTELRAAADELLDYVSYASLSELNAEKSKVADTSRRSESSKICELLLGMSAEVPLYTEASDIINSVGGVNPIQTAVISPFTADDSERIQSKQISLMQHAAQSSVDYAAVLTDISALFCSLIPPIEMSLCVPYFDAKIIYPQEENGQGMLSPLRFVSAASKTDVMQSYSSTDSDHKIGYDIAGMEIFCMPQMLAAADSDLSSLDAISKRGIEILNPLVPLLTLESANIQQVGINGSLYAQTKIDLKMILHDRSRLSEIEPLVSPEIFPTSTFRIVFGWSHPDTNKMTGNSYAKLINAMKVTQDFAISSVSLSATDASSLSISVSLISQGSFVSKSAKIITALGTYLPYTMVQTLVSRFVKIKSKQDKSGAKITSFSKVGSQILASIGDASSASRLVKVTDYYALNDLVQTLSPESNSNETDDLKLSRILVKLNNIEKGAAEISAGDRAATELTAISNFKQVNATWEYGNIKDPSFTTSNKALIPDTLKTTVSTIAAAANYIGSGSNGSSSPVVPFHAAVERLIAKPLLLSQPDLDEVRIHCFSFNSACGEMAEENIGNFPIDIDQIMHLSPDDKGLTQKSSVESAITRLLNQINTPSNVFYGLSSQQANIKVAANNVIAAAADKDSKETAEDTREAVAAAKLLVDAVNSGILERKKITNVDAAFIPPRIKHHIEILPAYSGVGDNRTKKKIARLIFFDERAGNFNKLANLIFAMMSTNNVAKIPRSTAALAELIDEGSPFLEIKSSDGESDFYAIKDKMTARAVAANLYPIIRIGADSSTVTSATYTSQPGGDVQNVYLLSALTGDSSGTQTGASSQNPLIDDVFIIPSSITITMLGNTCITRGQTYYVDFNTGTTLDNSYTVMSVTHSMKPGVFTTTAVLAPVFSASMKSLSRQIEELKTNIDQTSLTKWYRNEAGERKIPISIQLAIDALR